MVNVTSLQPELAAAVANNISNQAKNKQDNQAGQTKLVSRNFRKSKNTLVTKFSEQDEDTSLLFFFFFKQLAYHKIQQHQR